MECLPLEVVEKIAHYLSSKELAACCATSKEWRGVFNKDVFWKPRCDEILAAHLRVTASIVEPRFVSPEGKETSLSSICDWMLCYMRENHLWNNWRQQRFIRKEFKDLDDTGVAFEFCAYITTEHVILKSLCSRVVSLWNIRRLVYLCDVFNLSDDQNIDYSHLFGPNDLVILQKATLHMFRISSPINRPWTLQYTLTLGECSGSNLGVNMKCLISGSCLVVAGSMGSIKLVDLEKGNILIEIIFPTPLGLFGHSLDIIQPEKQSFEFGIVAGSYARESNNSLKKGSYLYKVFVYSLKHMDFENFETEVICTEMEKISFGYLLFDEYLSIFHSGTLRIYNYYTADLIKKILVNNYSVFTIFDLSRQVRCMKTSLVITRDSEKSPCMAWSISSYIQTNSHSLFFRKILGDDIKREEIAVYLINFDFKCNQMFTDVVEMSSNTLLNFW